MSVDTYTTFMQEPEPKDREQSIEAYLKSRLQSLDKAVAGYTSVSLQGLTGTVDLTPTQAKHRVVKLTGAPAGAVTLRIPHATGANADIHFVNACTGGSSTVTLKSTGANAGNASGVSIPTGRGRLVRHDGESAYPAALEVVTSAGGGLLVPHARVYNSLDQAVPNSVLTALAFNSERWDTNGIHDPAANTRLTLNRLGLWAVFGTASFQAHATGTRGLQLRVNGDLNLRYGNSSQTVNSGVSSPTLNIYTEIRATAVTDYVELMAIQDSGVSLNILTSLLASPEFGCHWISE